MHESPLPPRQQLAAAGKWPTVGERSPRPDDAPWTIQVRGAVARPYTLALEELRAWPQTAQVIDIHCVTRWSKLGVRYAGVPLASLVAKAVPEPSARFVSFVARSSRDHSTSLGLADALALQTLVALSVDGVALDKAHGGPVRVIVPDRYFYKSLKWLACIELLCEDRLGFWESTAGYHNTADVWREERYMAGGISKTEAAAMLAIRDISGRDLRGLAAGSRDLAGLVARGSLLRDADFRRCQLPGACFDGANLSNAHFEGADLKEASFRGADLEGADFEGADLRGVCLVGARLLGVSFCDATGSKDGRPNSAIIDGRTQIEAAALDDLMPPQRAFVQGALALHKCGEA